MKNKTFYSKIVFIKKKIFYKKILPDFIANKLDNFFNELHNKIIQIKDILRDVSRDKIIQIKDISRDTLTDLKDISRDTLTDLKDISRDTLIQSKDLSRDFLIKNKDKAKNNIKNYNYRKFFIELIKNLNLIKWNIDEKSDQEAVKNIDFIIANSLNVQSRIEKYYKRQSKIIYPPIKENYPNKNINEKYWLSVNRLVPEKRIEMQIEAFNRLNKKLIVVGNCDTHLKKYSDEIKLIANKNIHFLENIDDHQLTQLYKNCTGFITTAKDEDFGMSAVEAMAAGKPVIAPNEGGYKESVIDQENGFLIDDINPQKIIDSVYKIEENLNKDNEYYRLKCIERAGVFSNTNFSKQIESFLKENIYFSKEKKIIFIVGVPRSGTTWLWGLLTSHTEVSPLLKSDFGKNDNFLETNMFFDNNFEEIKYVLDKKNGKFLVEKTPDHILKIDEILQKFPTAKIIHIYRNPFSVFASYKFSNWNKKIESVNEWFEEYLKRINCIYKYKNHKNIYSLSYENLYKKPNKTLGEIFDFVGLNKKYLNKIILENKGISKSSEKHAIRKAEINSWKKEVSEKEKLFIYKKILENNSTKYFFNLSIIERFLLYIKSKLKNKKQIVFIVGVPRSGTTWVWKLLSGHPEIDLLTKNDFENTKHDKTPQETNMFFEYSIKTIKAVINKKEKKIIVEKTPLHVEKLDLIFKEFPEAKIIHVIRNPISIYASYKFTEFEDWKYKNISVEEWVKLYKNIFNSFKDKIKNPNILNIHYDELLKKDISCLKKIYEFLDILISEEDLKNIYNKFSYENSFPIISKKRSVNSLKNNLSENEIKYIKDNLKDEVDFLWT